MRRYLLAGVSVLVVSNSLAAQESLWSGTMTAGKDEINGNRVVGYNRSPAAPVMGELSDAELDFRGITYRVYSLLQAENNPLLGEWAVLLAFSPLLDHQDLESMMLTVGGTVLHASDSVSHHLRWPTKLPTDHPRVLFQLALLGPKPQLRPTGGSTPTLTQGREVVNRVAARTPLPTGVLERADADTTGLLPLKSLHLPLASGPDAVAPPASCDSSCRL